MAQKRMFDKTITNSDEFLEMPDSSQNLYFHLSMNADDDGFVNNWKSIMRMTGHKEDDLKVLVAKQFIIPFDSGVIVIKHWRINNYLRNDRYIETKYKEEKSKLTLDDNLVYQLDTNGRHSIDKNRIVKNSIDKNNIYEQEFNDIWELYPNKKGKSNAFKSFTKALKEGVSVETIKNGVINYVQYIQLEKVEPHYIKHGSTWFNQRCWDDDYTIKRKLTTRDLASKIDINKFLSEENEND